MKRVLFPLKVTTEGIWLAGRVARRVRDKIRGGKGPKSGSDGGGQQKKSPKASGIQTVELSEGSPEPEAGFEIGSRVLKVSAQGHLGLDIPEGAVGRITSIDAGSYGYLLYGDDGVPVLLNGVLGSDLLAY